MLFWNYPAFSIIQQMLAIWFLVPLPFLNSAWTSGSSWFAKCWSLASKILSMTWLAWVVVVQLLSLVQLFVIPWLQYTRLPCPSPSPGTCSNSYPLTAIGQWLAHSSVLPFLGIGMRLIFSSLVTSAGSSRFADILNVTPWYYHPSGFWIVLLEFHYLL